MTRLTNRQRTERQWDTIIAYQQAQVDLARAIRDYGIFSIQANEALRHVNRMRSILHRLK